MSGSTHEVMMTQRILSVNQKQMYEAFTADVGRLIAEQFEAFRLDQENSRRARREQDINPKLPDKSLRSTWSSPHKTSHAPKSKLNFDSEFHPTNVLQLYKFSGKGNYLEWERNMETWLCYHRILRKERLAFAISQLTGDAHKWWLQEVDDRWYYKEPTITLWEDLRELLRSKYAPPAPNRAQHTSAKVQRSAVQEKKPALVTDQKKTPTPVEAKTEPDPFGKLLKKVPKLVLTEKMEAKSTSQPKKATELAVVHKQSLNPSLESSGEPKQCKSSNLSKSKPVICYKCRKKGHVAAICPEEHELNITSLASKLSSPNSSSEVVNQAVENSSSCMMHLVLSKDVESGHTMEPESEKAEGSTKEKNQHSVSATSQACQADCVSSITIFKAEMSSNILQGTQVSLAYEFIRYWNNLTFTRSFKQPVFNAEISSIMHLIFPLSAKEDTGTLDVCIDLEGTTRTEHSMVIKTKPPDAPQLTKTRGNYLNSQKRMRANLLSLGADCTIVSSKPFQEKKTTLVPLLAPEFYFDKMKLKGKQEQGKNANLFAMVGKAKGADYFDPKFAISLEKMPCDTNHVPVPPSKLNELFQEVYPRKEPRKLQLYYSYHHNIALFHDEVFCARAKEKGEERDDKFLKELKARDHREQLSKDIDLQAIIQSGETIICLHQDASQSHIWRPGDYLGRSRNVLHEIWITSFLMFPEELKMDLSSFRSFQTYQWRPGEFLYTSRENTFATNHTLIQEEPPDPTPLPFTVILMNTEHNKELIQVSISLSRFVSHDLRVVSISLLSPEIIEKNLGLFKIHLKPFFCRKMQVKEKHDKYNALINAETCLLVYSDSMTVITHLLFAKSVENFAGTKEEPPDSKIISSNCFAGTGIGDVFMQHKKLFDYFRMIFEVGEQLWTPRIAGLFSLTRRIINNAYQLDLRGKYPMILLFDGSNLVLFVAGQTDLRTNLFQLGEDDVILRGSKETKHKASNIKGVMDDHGAKGVGKESKNALEEIFGSKTRFWRRKFHKEFRVSLQPCESSRGSLGPWRLYQVHPGHGASPRRLELGRMIHSHSFSLSSVLSQWVFRVRFLMRLVAHAFILATSSQIMIKAQAHCQEEFRGQNSRRKENDLKSHF